MATSQSDMERWLREQDEDELEFDDEPDADAFTEPAQPAVTPSTPAQEASPAPRAQPQRAQQPQPFSVPSWHVPPPPPPPAPPPPPPELAGLTGDVAGFARNWMAQPNRYLSDLATATRTAGDARLAKAETDQTRKIEEWAAGRGLVGSSYEGDQMVELAEALRRARSDEERQLLEMLATAETLDRESAFNAGLRGAAFGDTAGIDRFRAGLEGMELSNRMGLDREALQLERDRLAQQGEQFEQELGQEESQFSRGLQEQRAARLDAMGISREELSLRATEIQNQAQQAGRRLTLEEAQHQAEVGFRADQILLEGRALNIQEAQNEAEIELATDRLAQEAAQFGASLDFEQMRFGAEVGLQREQLAQRENEFARSHGLAEREFTDSQNRFAAEISEQIAARIQDENQFTRSLAETSAGRAMENALRTRALDLQDEGMGLDEAFRRAELDVDSRIRNRALELEREGMLREDAYKYAALEQDATFTARAQSLQAMGMRIDDAFRRAALEQDAWTSWQTLRLEAERTGDQARLAELDIILRGIASLGDDEDGSISRQLESVLGRAPRQDIQAPPFLNGSGVAGGVGDPWDWGDWMDGGDFTGGGGMGTGGSGGADNPFTVPSQPGSGFGPRPGSQPPTSGELDGIVQLVSDWQAGGFDPAEGENANTFNFAGQTYDMTDPDDLNRWADDVLSGANAPRNEGEFWIARTMLDQLGMDTSGLQIVPRTVADVISGTPEGNARPGMVFIEALGTADQPGWWDAVSSEFSRVTPEQRQAFEMGAEQAIGLTFGIGTPEWEDAMNRLFDTTRGENWWDEPNDDGSFDVGDTRRFGS